MKSSHGYPHRSRFLCWGFERYLTTGFGLRRGFVPRHFHAIRLLNGSPREFPADRPLIFFLNHPGWWDPIFAFLLARFLVPSRYPFAPIDREAMLRYPLLDRIGLFGVDRTPAGVKAFLRTSRAVSAQLDASLWLTPQGRFADFRERPIRFEPGLGHLASRSRGVFIPVAVEYRHWNERLPEALACVGQPVDVADLADRSADHCTERLQTSLEQTMNRLSEPAARRQTDDFTILLAGASGVGPVYDLVRRVRALVSRTKYQAEHGGEN